MGNFLGEGSIRKASKSIFGFGKRGAENGEKLADLAGSHSSRRVSLGEADRFLRENKIQRSKRTGIIGELSGKNKEKGLTKEQIEKNIRISKRITELGDGKTGYASGKVSFGSRDIETRSRVALGQAGGGEKGTAVRRFGLGSNSSGFASQKSNNPSAPSSPPPSSPRPGIGGGGIRPGF
ncbi:MAG: hypothetical protein PHZ04_00980 [Patescibacteria group bacterium]|nr:hypothetical protein [Patescibacteria group bacterium]MDD5554922.1 hypothetical protein [Patescibacteria group bacterium]